MTYPSTSGKNSLWLCAYCRWQSHLSAQPCTDRHTHRTLHNPTHKRDEVVWTAASSAVCLPTLQGPTTGGCLHLEQVVPALCPGHSRTAFSETEHAGCHMQQAKRPQLDLLRNNERTKTTRPCPVHSTSHVQGSCCDAATHSCCCNTVAYAAQSCLIYHRQLWTSRRHSIKIQPQYRCTHCDTAGQFRQSHCGTVHAPTAPQVWMPSQ